MTAYTPEDSASLYLEESAFDQRLIYFRYIAAKKFLRGNTCLELGPGSGYMTRLLQHDFEELSVVDASQTNLNNLDCMSSVKKYCSFFEDFEPDNKFDTIVMEHVLEHVDDPSLILQKAHKWSSENGIYIIGVPNSNSLHRLAAVCMP